MTRAPRVPLLALAAALSLSGCADKPAPRQEPAGRPPLAATSATQAPAYQSGGTYDAADYPGPVQQVAAWAYEPAVKSTSAPTKKCSAYKTVAGKRKCSSYTTTPGKVTTTDDEDWYLVLADGTRVDVDAATQARYPAGVTYP